MLLDNVWLPFTMFTVHICRAALCIFVTALSCAEHFSLKHIEPVCFLPEILVYVPGIPTLAYGLASWMLVRFHEDIDTSKGQVRIYFLNKEEKNARY